MSTKKLTKKEVKQLIADRDYWNELAEIVGWRLQGFTDRKMGSFITPSLHGKEMIQMTGDQRDAIIKAIEY